MVTHQKEVYYKLGIWHLDLTHKTKAKQQLPWMVTYHPKDSHPQPKDGHPPGGNVVQTWNLALEFFSQNEIQVTASMDGHLLSLGLSPTNPWMVTHQKEVHYRLGTLFTKLTPGDDYNGWSPTIPSLAPHPPRDGHPPEGSLTLFNKYLALFGPTSLAKFDPTP